MSSYVQTRWYRAPELLFKSHCYTNKVDIWSVGCIFAELVLREPFIQGTNSQDQIEKMIYVLGTPPIEIISKIEFNEIRFFIENLIFKKEIDFKKVFTSLSKCAILLLKKLLDYKITDRISAEEALKHSFFTSIAKHKELEVNELDDFAEIGKNIYEMKKDLYNELLDFYKDDEIEKTAVIDSESIL
ncbi:MAP kinase [Gurleya vavrai]